MRTFIVARLDTEIRVVKAAQAGLHLVKMADTSGSAELLASREILVRLYNALSSYLSSEASNEPG